MKIKHTGCFQVILGDTLVLQKPHKKCFSTLAALLHPEGPQVRAALKEGEGSWTLADLTASLRPDNSGMAGQQALWGEGSQWPAVGARTAGLRQLHRQSWAAGVREQAPDPVVFHCPVEATEEREGEPRGRFHPLLLL